MRQAKLIQDEIDAKSGGKVKSMKEFIEEYLPRKYGLPALVRKGGRYSAEVDDSALSFWPKKRG